MFLQVWRKDIYYAIQSNEPPASIEATTLAEVNLYVQ